MKISEFMEQELVSIPYGTGKIDALYYKSTVPRQGEGKETVVIHVHGFLGNFLEGSQKFLPPLLARAGYSSLCINTRLATFGLFFGYGIIDDTIPQLDAAIVYLKKLGYTSIVLSGYSIGGSVVLRYASLRSDVSKFPSLKGIIAISTPYSNPDSVRRRWERWGSNPSYDEIYRRVRETLRPDPMHTAEDRTIVIYRARGETLNPEHAEVYTYKTWWFLAGPEAEPAKCYKQITGINIPLLLIQGRDDKDLRPDEASDLAGLAVEAGNRDASALYLDAGHDFDGCEETLGEAVAGWLDRRFGGNARQSG